MLTGGGSNAVTEAVTLHYFPEAKRIRVSRIRAVYNVTLDLYCICSGPVRCEARRSSKNHTIKAHDKCGSKSKITPSVEVKPIKLLHFSFYACRYFLCRLLLNLVHLKY
ncbi:hypothetical protein ILYODFUR_020070 [Ilyodon furcidens]|uniref:Uncharacterized protein n=1 Tax=Ilyodon furcidens TaxID=33524 RepID=A0ABV0TKB8_9TELE